VDNRRDINQEEKSLIERCKQKNFAAFRNLMERYQSRIYAVCYGIVRNREDALDIMQDVFIKVYNSIHAFKGESGLYVWIYRIAVNTSLDYYRKRKRKQQLLERTLTERKRVHKTVQYRTPADITMNLELKEVVSVAIESLPKKHKSVVVLREIEGLSYQEIAKVLKCSVGTVMSRLFYARKRLITLLQKYIKPNGAKRETK